MSESGFTLPEALLQLVIFLLVMSSIPQIYTWYSKISESFLGTQTIAYELFLNEFRNDLLNVIEIGTPTNNSVEILVKNNESGGSGNNYYYRYNYRFSNKRISKSYDTSNGMNIMLTGLKKATFQLNDEKLTLNTEFKNHMRKERIIVVPQKEE